MNSNSTTSFGRVAKISFDVKANEAFLADGYGNHRVAVIDMDNGKIKRFWGAYGHVPSDSNLGPYNPDAPLHSSSATRCTAPSQRRMAWCTSAIVRTTVFRSSKRAASSSRKRSSAADARRRLRVGYRVLSRSRAEIHLHGRRKERAACT